MAYYCNSFGYCYYENDWYVWGRWVLLGGLILLGVLFCLILHCVNRRRAKRGNGPMRYTGWTVPSYNQSQQQYSYGANQQTGYSQNANPPNQGQTPYPMNNYPPYGQQQGQFNYSQPTAGANEGAPAAYYDATQTEAQDGYRPPAYPPPTKV